MLETLNINMLIYMGVCLVRAIKKKNAVSFQKQVFSLAKGCYTWEITQSFSFAWKWNWNLSLVQHK